MSDIDLYASKASFASGQINSSMIGSHNDDIYLNGAKKLFNMVVTPQGSVKRRPPTSFCSIDTEDKLASKIVSFNITQTIGFLYFFYFSGKELKLEIFCANSYKKVFTDDICKRKIKNTR